MSNVSDEELMRQAFVLLEQARARAPLTTEQYEELVDQVEALVDQAESPMAVRMVTGEQLGWLDPAEQLGPSDRG